MSKVRRDSLIGGEVFGRLTVTELDFVKRSADGKHSERVMWCHCSCGKNVSIRTSNLKSGNTLSCGCYHAQRTTSSNQQRRKPDGKLETEERAS